MPLSAANLARQYQVTFWTISGFKSDPPESFKAAITQVMKDNVVNWKNVMVAYEVSDGGFRHYHVGLETYTPTRLLKPCKKMRAWMAQQPFVDKKSIQVWVGSVPHGGERSAVDNNYRQGMALVQHYLQNPSKQKVVDGQVVTEMDTAEWSIWQKIKELHEAKRANPYREVGMPECAADYDRDMDRIIQDATALANSWPRDADPITFRQYQVLMWQRQSQRSGNIFVLPTPKS